jgi:hypothetical protein
MNSSYFFPEKVLKNRPSPFDDLGVSGSFVFFQHVYRSWRACRIMSGSQLTYLQREKAKGQDLPIPPFAYKRPYN